MKGRAADSLSRGPMTCLHRLTAMGDPIPQFLLHGHQWTLTSNPPTHPSCVSLQSLEEALKYCNYLFTFVFVVEAILKLVAFGFRRFFKDRLEMGWW